MLVGFESSDDGAVFQFDKERALVQSVDFFTPIVDDPYQFGVIAAANALSDLYAMGAKPLTALSLVCFPHKTLPGEILTEIVAGGAAKVCESGAVVVGGHSVGDEEIKFGYAVTGFIHPDAFWANNSPQIGDALVLTKPLGTGLLTTAVKRGKLGASYLKQPISEMSRLNKVGAECARSFEIHAATDITGFGLFGHLFEMVRTAHLGARINCAALPLFDGVWQAVRAESFTLAHQTNASYCEDYTIVRSAAFKRFEKILFDPQTSGGLLFALPPDQAQDFVKTLVALDHEAVQIGHITGQAELRCHG